MSAISLKLPPELEARLDAAAKRSGVTRSEYVRNAIERSLDQSTDQSAGTVGEVAGHLIGCLQGSGDLSHNPARMNGYGR